MHEEVCSKNPNPTSKRRNNAIVDFVISMNLDW